MPMDLVGPAAGPREPKAVVAGEAWVQADSAAAVLAGVEAAGAAVDLAGDANGDEIPRTKHNEIQLWR